MFFVFFVWLSQLGSCLTGHQLELTTPPEDPAAVRAVGARALAEHRVLTDGPGMALGWPWGWTLTLWQRG